MLSERKNIVLGIVLSYVALAISMLASFFVTPIILDNIGDRNYGLFSFCNSITSWLAIVSTSLGASYIFFANKEKKEEQSDSKTNSLFFKMLFILGIAVTVIVCAATAILKFSGFRFNKYSNSENDVILLLLLISGLTISITVFLSCFSLYNNYKKSFAFVRGIQVIGTIGLHLANVFLAITTKSIISIAIATLANALFNGLANLFFALTAKKMVFTKTRFDQNRKLLNTIIKYSSVIVISGVISNLDSNLDKTLLGAMVNAESVTMYQLSINYASQLTVLAFTFTEVMRPTLYELYRNDKIKEANDVFLKVCKMQSIVVLLIIGGFIACGYHFVILWIGEKRIEVYFYSVVLFVTNIVPLTKSLSGEAFKAVNSHKIPMLISILAILVNLAISILLLVVLDKEYAVWACIVGTIIPRIIFGWIVSPFVAYKKMQLPMSKYYFNLLKIFLIAVVAVIPSMALTLYFKNVEIRTVFKVLIEGSVFVVIFIIGNILFERKALKDLMKTLFKRKTQLKGQ